MSVLHPLGTAAALIGVVLKGRTGEIGVIPGIIKMAKDNDRLVENMLGEWKRSMLTFWVLGLLLQRSMYGLEIKKEIELSSEGKLKLGASTIYQLLRRLESRSLVTSRWERTEQGPPRAYYELAPAGRELIYRYAHEVISPDSPISRAMGKLTALIFHQS